MRFDLTEFDAGGATPSPLGVDWTLPVASPVDTAGESRQKTRLVSGQGQIAVPGKPLTAYLCFQTNYYVSLQTTQPGDRLDLRKGVLQYSSIDPVTDLQTLQFSPETQGGEMHVLVQLGAAPLPRLVGACTAQNARTTCIAVGPPEVHLVYADTFLPAPTVPNQLVDRMLAEAESLPAVLAEVRVPKGYSPPTPGAIQVTLTSLDGIGDPIQSDPYWPPTVQDILCEQAAGNDRFDAYRSRPIVCTTEAFTGGTPSGLPGTRIYQRLNRRLQVRPEDGHLCQAGPPAPRAELALETNPPIPTKDQYPAFNPVVNGRLNLVQGETGTIKMTWGNDMPAGTLLSLQQDPAAMEVLTEAGWVSTLTGLAADSYRDDAGDVVLRVRPVDVPGPPHALDSTMVLSASLAGRPPSQAQLMVRAVAPWKRVKLVVHVIRNPPNIDPAMTPVVQNRQIAGILELTNKIYRQAGIQFELAPIDIRMFRKDELLEYVDSPANIQLIRGLRNGEPANPPGTQNLTIVFTATVNGQPNGLAYPGEHVAVLGEKLDDRNMRHWAHELSHLLGNQRDFSGIQNRLKLMLHDETTLSTRTIDIGNELSPDEVRLIRTTLPGGFVR